VSEVDPLAPRRPGRLPHHEPPRPRSATRVKKTSPIPPRQGPPGQASPDHQGDAGLGPRGCRHREGGRRGRGQGPPRFDVRARRAGRRCLRRHGPSHRRSLRGGLHGRELRGGLEGQRWPNAHDPWNPAHPKLNLHGLHGSARQYPDHRRGLRRPSSGRHGAPSRAPSLGRRHRSRGRWQCSGRLWRWWSRGISPERSRRRRRRLSCPSCARCGGSW